MKRNKYYKEIYFDVPVVIYPKSNNTNINEYEISEIIDNKLKLPFEINEEEIEYIEANGEENNFYSSIIEKCNNKNLIFAGNLNLYFKGLVEKNEIYEDFYFDIPPVLFEKVISILNKITNDLKKFGLIIEMADANKDFYLSLPDDPDYIKLNDIFVIADENSVLSATEEIKFLKENIDLNFIDAFLLTKNINFIKNIKNAVKVNSSHHILKEEIKKRFNELKNVSFNKRDIAKFIEYRENPVRALFLNKEERDKAVGFLMAFNVNKEKNIKRTELNHFSSL